MPTIDANGLTVACAVAGSGPPLILLHGATGSGPAHMGGLTRALRDRFTTYAPDARGHGGTRWDASAGLRTADLVADVIALADALGLASFHLLGYSMGGMTALTLAAHHGARLRSLVALSIGTDREPRLAIGRALMDVTRIERDDPAWAASLAARHDPVQGPGAWRRLLPAIVRDIADQPLLTPAELRGIAIPTLVVAGDRDPFVPVDQASGLARQVRGGRLLVLPGRDHDLLAGRDPVLDAGLATFYDAIDLGRDQEDLP